MKKAETKFYVRRVEPLSNFNYSIGKTHREALTNSLSRIQIRLKNSACGEEKLIADAYKYATAWVQAKEYFLSEYIKKNNCIPDELNPKYRDRIKCIGIHTKKYDKTRSDKIIRRFKIGKLDNNKLFGYKYRSKSEFAAKLCEISEIFGFNPHQIEILTYILPENNSIKEDSFSNSLLYDIELRPIATEKVDLYELVNNLSEYSKRTPYVLADEYHLCIEANESLPVYEQWLHLIAGFYHEVYQYYYIMEDSEPKQIRIKNYLGKYLTKEYNDNLKNYDFIINKEKYYLKQDSMLAELLINMKSLCEDLGLINNIAFFFL